MQSITAGSTHKLKPVRRAPAENKKIRLTPDDRHRLHVPNQSCLDNPMCASNPDTTDDGKRPSLTCATAAGKILVHCPHSQRGLGSGAARRSADAPSSPDRGESETAATSAGGNLGGEETDFDGDIRFLNMNREVIRGIRGRLSKIRAVPRILTQYWSTL